MPEKLDSSLRKLSSMQTTPYNPINQKVHLRAKNENTLEIVK